MAGNLSTRNERLRYARIASGYRTAAEAATAHGWKESAYRHHENGTSGFRLERGEEYARAFGIPVEWLLFGRGPPPDTARLQAREHEEFEERRQRRWAESAQRDREERPFGSREVHEIPILGDVQAGVWQEPHALTDLPELPAGDSLRDWGVDTIAVSVPGYERAQLYALRVRGPSMNLEYPDGRFVIIAPAAEAGVRDGDHVVVQRNRAGLVETTLKELRVDSEGRAQLWPRSSDPAHKEPIALKPSSGDQDRPRIIGVVVADYSRRVRPDRPANIRFDDGHAE